VIIFFFKGASGMLRPLFYILKDQDFMAKYNWIMGIIFTILVLTIVPTFGLVGCVIAFAASELTFIAILTLRMHKKFNFSIMPF
jgi:O-antigen/teichoic acid export membrane protein